MIVLVSSVFIDLIYFDSILVHVCNSLCNWNGIVGGGQYQALKTLTMQLDLLWGRRSNVWAKSSIRFVPQKVKGAKRLRTENIDYLIT